MRAISKVLCRFVQKWLPSAYVLALLLTLVAFVGAWALTDSSLLDCVTYMSQGMYSLLSFTMQMGICFKREGPKLSQNLGS